MFLPGQVSPCDHGCDDGQGPGAWTAISLAIWARGPVFLWWVRVFGLQVTETETG